MLLDHAGCSGDVPERRGCAGAPGMCRSAGDVPERRGCAGAPGMCQGCAGVQDLHHVLFVFV